MLIPLCNKSGDLITTPVTTHVEPYVQGFAKIVTRTLTRNEGLPAELRVIVQGTLRELRLISMDLLGMPCRFPTSSG